MPAPRKVTVLGGNGFIGSHVVERFAHEDDVTIVCRSNYESDHSAKTVVGSIADLSTIGPAITDADLVICLASESLPATSNDDLGAEVQNHVGATIALAQFAANAGVGQFIFCSSGGTVYGTTSDAPLVESAPTAPINGYGVSKLAIEHYLRVLSRLSDMRVLSLRVGNPYGVGQDPHRKHGFISAAVHSALTGEELTIWGDGSTIRDFIYVEDVADAFHAASRYTGAEQIMNIGSGRGTSLLTVIDAVGKAFERSVNTVFVESRSVDVAANVLDISRAQAELGWRPQISLDRGLDRLAASIAERQ